MKGEDVTAAELAHAEEFLRITQGFIPEHHGIKRSDLIRLLAWYGALRADRAIPRKLFEKKTKKTKALGAEQA